MKAWPRTEPFTWNLQSSQNDCEEQYGDRSKRDNWGVYTAGIERRQVPLKN